MSQPERTFRIGSVSASVFVNETKGKDKRAFRSVSLQRRYKDGDEWKSSTSFGLADLPVAIAVLQMAMTHVAAEEADTTA